MKKSELRCWGCILIMLLLLAAPLFSGCRAKLPPEKETTVITTTETLYDTTFVDVPDSSAVKALIECRNGKPVLREVVKMVSGRKLRVPMLTLKNDTIGCNCLSDSLKLYAFWKSKQVTTTTKKQTPILIDKPLTRWQTTQIWLGRIFILLGLIWAGWIIQNKLKR